MNNTTKPTDNSLVLPNNGPIIEAPPPPIDTSKPARLGMWVLGVGFGGFLLWAALAPLDEGVPTQGVVALDTKRKAIQHLSGGIVKEVFVKEGSFVKEGDPLLSVDTDAPSMQREPARSRYLNFKANEGRLLAEQAEAKYVTFDSTLEAKLDNPQVRQILDNQRTLFESRRLSQLADQQAIRESILGQEAAISGYEGVLANRKAQREYLMEELKGVRELVKEGYAPRNRQLELERQAAENEGSILELHANIRRAQQSIAEIRARAVQRKQDFQKEVAGQLVEARNQAQIAHDELERAILRSPTEGQVVGLAVHNVGAIITPGQLLMNIVPQHEYLLLETKVPPHLIDRVQPGMVTDVRFSTFAHSPVLVIEGKVDSVSSDLITDPRTQQEYYLARIVITPQGMKDLGNRQLQAGMPADVVIRSGERSLLKYLLHPLVKRMAASMKEE